MAQTEQPKRRNAQATGMQGVYLVAAELTKRGLTVAPTSRSAFGADLLATDEQCKRAWSVQVKTNFGRPTFWLVNKHSDKVSSPSHVFVLVNLNQANARQRSLPPEFYVVPSRVIAQRMRTTPPRKSGTIFYSVFATDLANYRDRWSVFTKRATES
jgi:hypothetical protein